ncbi:MAG: T9SS type A sorting domain-containing protein, partial [Bacteroidales bacterium]|nr:T9SS type A sorting domain-containing protein [Bacteroidales bacterium]
PWSTLGCNDPTDENTVCNSGNNVSQFCFSTHAYRGGPQLIAGNPEQTPCVCDMLTPLTGTFASVGPWENIYGFDINDEGWSVQIYDCENTDIGSFLHASIHFVNYSFCDSTEVLYELADVSIPINDASCNANLASQHTLPLENTSTFGFEEGNPQICGVSVNETNNPVIYWNSFNTVVIDSVVVFCVDTENSSMNRIGAEKFTGSNNFTDNAALPHLVEAEYCIGFKNICGNLTLMSTVQSSILLNLIPSNNSYLLEWSPNESLSDKTLSVYRGLNPENLEFVTSVSYSTHVFADIFDSQGEYVYYKISCETNDCSEGKSSLNLNSNIATNDPYYFTSHVAGFTIEEAKIYPNPAKNSIWINLKGNRTNLEICDLNGKKLIVKNAFTGGEINIENLKAGVYVVKLDTEGSIGVRKLVVE